MSMCVRWWAADAGSDVVPGHESTFFAPHPPLNIRRYCVLMKPIRCDGSDVCCPFMYVGTVAAPATEYSIALTGINADGSATALWLGPANSRPVLARYYPGEAKLVEGQISGPPLRYSEKALQAHKKACKQIRLLQPVSGFVEIPDGLELDINRLFIQTLPGNEILLVSSYYTKYDETDRNVNAILLDLNGKLIRTGRIGDNVGHVLADSLGRIWVGYDDVYLSDLATGVKVWTSDFNSANEYMSLDTTEGTPIGIYDCLSLNVTDDVVWASSYSNAPLAEIYDGRVKLFRRVGGNDPCGLLVNNRTIAVFEGITLKLFSLDNERSKAELCAVCNLRLPFAEPTWRIKPACRGNTANLFCGPDWYTLRLHDLLPTVA